MLVQLASMRTALAEALIELGSKDPRVVALGADTSVSIKTSLFGDRYPERFFNVGIAEANMIGIAAGLALSGKIPFVSTYSAFVPGKCLDQIRNAIAYPRLDVKIVSSHGGLSVGPDGASHQTVEDLAAMRAVPNMHVIVPSDGPSTKSLIMQASITSGPFYFRLARPDIPTIHTLTSDLKIGRATVLRAGKDVSLIACGLLVNEALEAAETLSKENISAEVIDSHTLKPLDTETILRSARKTGAIVTSEEHNMIGGLGGAVTEAVCDSYPVPVARIGIHDTFGESGEHPELMKKYGLTSKEIIETARKIVRTR